MNKLIQSKRSCPVCFSEKAKKLYSQNFHNKEIALMNGYDVVSCQNCGFVYADNIPSQVEFDEYYATRSKYEFYYADGVVSDRYIDHFRKIFNFIAPYIINKKNKILDIGCSTGALLSVFKKHGYKDLKGIDPSPGCVRFVKNIYKINASTDNISSLNHKEKFDLIILSAVLEHLVDLDLAIKKIKSMLKENGLLFIEIPDVERFASYMFTPFQQFSIEHINYFSKNSVRNLLSKFSFKIIETKKDENRINQTIDPDIFILSKKTKKGPAKIIEDNISEKKAKEYILKCKKLDLDVRNKIKKKLSSKNKIIVWGAGTHTQRLIGSALDLTRILFFVDSNTNYKGKKIKGVEVKSPSEIKYFYKNIPILISTYSYQKEIIHQIRKTLKLNNEIIKIY